MQSLSSTATALVASGILLVANLQAQQAPTQNTPPASTGKTASGAKATGAATANQRSATTLQTDKEKLSYAMGMNIGTSLHQQSAHVEIDPQILARGISDALAGGKMMLTEQEAQAVLDKLQQQLRAAQEEKQQAAAEANKKEGEAFLAANKTKEGVVTLPSGLQYKILRQGTGPKPALTDTIVCNYKGTFINGKVFDSSYDSGQPITIPVSHVIKGFTEALQLMPVGSQWELVLPPDLAYGDAGAGEDIGPGSTIILTVELLAIEAPGAKGADAPAGQSPSAGPNQSGSASPN
jgi:FKBP-type peptidyl-prolyl cis-trans isomerase FklB